VYRTGCLTVLPSAPPGGPCYEFVREDPLLHLMSDDSGSVETAFMEAVNCPSFFS